MAPRKEKSEKPNADEGTKIIVDYLRKQNRPYSAIDISANLHNKVTKSTTLIPSHLHPAPKSNTRSAHAAKVLKTLRENNIITGKDAGKQTVYHTLQSLDDYLSLEDLAALDATTTALRGAIADLKSEEKILRSSLASLNATLSTDELRTSVTCLKKAKAEFGARLSPLRKGDVMPVMPEERVEVDRLWSQWAKRAEGRKKIAIELWAMLSEDMPEGMTKEEMWEEWGLEADE